MDTPIMIIGVVLIVIITLPLYFVAQSHKLDQNMIKSVFAQHSQNNRYQFQLLDTKNRKALGMDIKKKAVLFIDFNLKEPYVSFLDLNKSEHCNVATSGASGKSNILKKIEWTFTAKNGIVHENTVLFHDSEKNYIVPVYAQEELKLAREWQQVIQKHL